MKLKYIIVASIMLISLTGCFNTNNTASITELGLIKQQVTEQIDEFKSQGIEIGVAVVNEEKRKVLIYTDNKITEEQISKLQNQFGQNKIEILKSESLLF